MSSKEAPRPGLVRAVLDRKVTTHEAAKALNLSVRQFRRLRRRYEATGLAGLVHQLRGRPSNHQGDSRARERVRELMTTTYVGLNDCHLTEKLREVEGLEVSRSTVRRVRLELGRAAKRPRRGPRYFRRREREARRGQRVLVDASEYRWLGEAEPIFTLVAAQDDATGQILALAFRPHEDLHGYAVLLRALFTDHGLPLEIYGDKVAVFVRNDDHWNLAEQLAGRQRPTQLGQALEDLAITYIPADTPQAKGRIERLWGTLHDRLPAEFALHGITTRAQAEAFLAEFIIDFNRRFAVAPREAALAWRRPPRDLDRILACRHTRQVARDATVTLPGRTVQLPRGTARPGTTVELRELLDGQLLVLRGGRCIARQDPPPGPFTLVPRGRQRGASRDPLPGDVPGSSTIAVRPAVRVRTRAPRAPRDRPPRPPAATHPWRRRSPLQPSPSPG